MPPTHDVIIIGAGPAGSAAAVRARGLGLTAALVDKADFPRDKLCGGGITQRSRRYMQEIFGQGIDERAAFHTCQRVRFTAGDRILGEVADAPPLHVVRRRDFDATLQAEALRAGTEPFMGARITELDTAAARVVLQGGKRLQGSVLIGADGVNSQVARSLFGRAFDPDSIGFCLEVEAPPRPENPADLVEIDFLAARWGYGWVFPRADALVLGVGGISRHNGDMKHRLAAYLGQHGLDGTGPKCKGQFIPAGDFREVPGRGRVLLAGDAAGMVDPITGEGIAYAMKTGALAADAAARALARDAPADALPLYRAAVAPIQTELRLARKLRAGIFARPIHGRFLNVVAAQPGMQRGFLRPLAGEIEYSQIRRFFFLRLLRRAVMTMFARRPSA